MIVRERSKITEYIARRICARATAREIASEYVDANWHLFLAVADEALKAVNDYDAARAQEVA